MVDNLCGLLEVGEEDEGQVVLVPVPVASVNISARLVNFTAEVRVGQSYVNREATALSCAKKNIYFFKDLFLPEW